MGSQFGGAKKSSKKGSKKMSWGGKRKSSKKASKKSSKKGSRKGSKMEGGKRKASKKSSKKANVMEEVKKSSKKSSKKGSRKGSKQSRALPPALLLFQKLVKYVADKIGKAGRPAMTIAGQVKRDVSAKNPGLEVKELIDKAMKHFDENLEKYKKMA